MVTTVARAVRATMCPARDRERTTGRVVVGPPPPPGHAPEDVVAATRQRRSDGARRYILYDDTLEAGRVADSRISVDEAVVVDRELWR
jgi:hypothetical protein